jgi:hypothetical protein
VSTILPPAPPLPPDLGSAPDPEALIEEARRRARRRRALYALAGLLAAGAAITGFAGFHGGDHRSRSNPGSDSSALPPTVSRPIRAPANGPLALVEGTYADRIVLVGQRGRLIKELPICRPPRCGEIQSAAWSPDGRMLAYGTMRGGGEFSAAPRDGLHLLDLKTNRDYLLSPEWSNWQDLSWSPDGTKLAYVAAGAAYVMRVAKPEWITPIRTNATSPTWSPDGRLIAFDRCIGLASGIDVARSDGSHLRRLTRLGCSPAWSHDGTRIAYTVWCGIKLVTPTGTQLTPPGAWRCQHVGVAGPPTWSPDSRKLAIAGRDGVYVMNRDGSGLNRIWDRPAERPSWRPVPPD